MSSHKWESFVNYQVYCHPHLFLELVRLIPRVLGPLRLPPLTLLETHQPGWVKFPSLRAPGNLGSRGGYPEESPSLLSGQRLLSPGTSGCLVLPRCLSPPPSTLTLHSQHYFLTGFSAFSLCAEQHVLDHYPALARSSLLTSVNAHINSMYGYTMF